MWAQNCILARSTPQHPTSARKNRLRCPPTVPCVCPLAAGTSQRHLLGQSGGELVSSWCPEKKGPAPKSESKGFQTQTASCQTFEDLHLRHADKRTDTHKQVSAPPASTMSANDPLGVHVGGEGACLLPARLSAAAVVFCMFKLSSSSVWRICNRGAHFSGACPRPAPPSPGPDHHPGAKCRGEIWCG
jgi:hypothetical protein